MLFEQRLQIDLARQLAVQCGVNATDHRREMRHKGQPNRITIYACQPLFDFRQMPMSRDSVGLEIIGCFRE